MNENAITVAHQLRALPPELLSIVQSPETTQNVDAIGARYHLSEEQRDALSNEIYLVLIGLDSLDDFSRNVQREMQISTQIGTPLVKEVQQQIFRPIEKMIRAFNQKQMGEEPQDQSTTTLGEKVSPLRPTSESAKEPNAAIGLPPINLPTGTSATDSGETLPKPTADQTAGSHAATPNTSETNEPAGNEQEKKHPFNADPYREPLE